MGSWFLGVLSEAQSGLSVNPCPVYGWPGVKFSQNGIVRRIEIGDVQHGGFDTDSTDYPRSRDSIVMDIGNDVRKHLQLYSIGAATEGVGIQEVRQIILRGCRTAVQPIDRMGKIHAAILLWLPFRDKCSVFCCLRHRFQSFRGIEAQEPHTGNLRTSIRFVDSESEIVEEKFLTTSDTREERA
jgi:hypothetical protein